MAARIPESDGGAIAISKSGNVGFGWNSEQMAWAYSRGVDIHYGVNRGEDLIEPLSNEIPPIRGYSEPFPIISRCVIILPFVSTLWQFMCT
jgi:hypothetical protein